MNNPITKRLVSRGIMVTAVSLFILGTIIHAASADSSSSIPDIGMVTLDMKGISTADDAKFAEESIREIEGVTSVTVRGKTAGVTFRIDQIAESGLVKKINAPGLYLVFVHQFDKKDMANVCPVPPGLHNAILKAKRFFGM